MCFTVKVLCQNSLHFSIELDQFLTVDSNVKQNKLSGDLPVKFLNGVVLNDTERKRKKKELDDDESEDSPCHQDVNK